MRVFYIIKLLSSKTSILHVFFLTIMLLLYKSCIIIYINEVILLLLFNFKKVDYLFKVFALSFNLLSFSYIRYPFTSIKKRN